MQKTAYILMTLWLSLFVTGCDSFMYDDLTDCPQGVNFSFYGQTPCEAAPTYPEAIKQVRVFAFDENNLLAAMYEDKNVLLTADYLLETTFFKTGIFTFVAWGGTNLTSYDFTPFNIGETTKEQMFVSLKRQSTELSEKLSPLYYGVSQPLTIIDRTKTGSVYDHVVFNMQELTNRLRFTIRGLSELETYSVTITDDNGVYNFDGDFAKDSRFDYVTTVSNEDGKLKADFVLMKLAEGRNAVLTVKNVVTDKVVYSANLVKDLIMYRGESGEPPYSLECDHDFDINIIFGTDPDNHETYMLVKAIVNDWNVVSRPIILE